MPCVAPQLWCAVLEQLRKGCVTAENTIAFSEPVWIFCLAYAESEIRGGTARREMLMVAGRSAEFQAINQMLEKGAELKNVALTTISLLWSESGPKGDTQR